MSTTQDWAGELGRRWAVQAEAQDRLLGVFEAAGMAALGPVQGRRVLDLGCGPGASTLALARAGAQATGLDVSADLLALARRRAEAAGVDAEFILADAARDPLGGPYDALFSRFGAMFFDAPEPAWRRLRDAMAPGAPMAVVAWRSVAENGWVHAPLKLIGDLLDPMDRPAPGAPGPFGWQDPELTIPWLEGAGWRGVTFGRLDADLALEAGDAPTPEARAADAVVLGPHPLSGRIPEEAREAARARLTEGLAGAVRDGKVRLPAAVWIATARA